MGMKLVGNFIDAYDRTARLYPALICLIPVVAVAVGVHGAVLSINSGLVTLVSSLGGLFFLMSISRDRGKSLEQSLFSSWGGKPTTQLLRHCDHTLDRVTKQRFQDFLSKQVGVKFPTAEDEAADPAAADVVYESGSVWLLGKTRDRTKFAFVFRENVNYGFMRNALGMKPIGITISVLAMLWTLAASAVLTIDGVDWKAALAAPVGHKVAFLVALVVCLAWAFLIRGSAVRRVAFAYANMLLRSCDALPKKR